MRHSLACRRFFDLPAVICSKPNRLLGINTRRSEATFTLPATN
jgi:hypothetical protein